jgi:asparagine synthase (glutamine-hydrolysing)
MRGGFVACLGDHRGLLELAAERLRWHRGHAVCHRHGGLEVAALCDPRDGPIVETGSGVLVLVHGAPVDSLPALQARCARFAALHWDGDVLRASRDPMGLAPLFYRVTDGAVWLATEIHALLGVAPNTPNLEVLSARAAFAPIDEETGWVGIRRVLPGCTLEIDAALHSRMRRYWDPAGRFGTYPGNRRDAAGELRGHLRHAVERCYEPGGGLVLSGGQDSAAIAVSMPPDKARPHLVHIAFPTLPRTQEARYAEAVASRVGMPLHWVSGDLSPWDIDAELDLLSVPYNRLPYGIDGPAQAHLVANGVEVALDGHDGDGVLGPGGGAWGRLLMDGEFERLGALGRTYGLNKLARGLASDFLPPALRPPRYALRPTYLHRVAGYFSDDLRSRVDAGDIARWTWPSRFWQTRQIHPLLPRATISFEQKELEAARNGIDLRHPFADRELVDFMISLPCAAKADPVRTKSLLLEALGEELPELIRARPKSDYMEVVRHRVDPARCVDVIRSSRVQLPGIDYRRLYQQGDADPEVIPLYLLVNLAKAHQFVLRAG